METVLLVLLFLGLPLAVAYWRYRASPQAVWKQRVNHFVWELLLRHHRLRAETEGVALTLKNLADEAFRRHLRTIPLEKLTDFANIGSGTIAKLRDMGCRGLEDVLNGHFEGVPGIGHVRAADLRAAADSLVRDARARFDAGACPEAQEYRRKVDEIRANDRGQTVARLQELEAIEAGLDQMKTLHQLAREVTFIGFLLRVRVPGLTPDVLLHPFPTVTVAPSPPAPISVPAAAPVPPPIALTAAVAAAKPVTEPFSVLPRRPSVPTSPPPPADLFRAELNASGVNTKTDPGEHPGLARMRAVIGLGLLIARADGRVAQSEKRAIRGYLEQTFGHDPVLLRNIDPLMERTEKAVPDEAAALAAARTTVPAQERLAVYRWLERIADASGERNQKERDALARVATGLEVSLDRDQPNRPTETKQEVANGTPKPPVDKPLVVGVPTPVEKAEAAAPDHRAVLEIAPDVPLDPDLIRRRYQLLTEKLDPGKAAAFGQEFVRMVEEKRARVRVAAEALIAPFNEPLEKPVPPPPTDIRHNPDLDDVFGA